MRRPARALLEAPHDTALFERARALSRAGKSEARETMSFRSQNGFHEQFKGAATVDVESTVSPDSKQIHETLMVVIGESRVIATGMASAGAQTLFAAMPDPAKPADTLFIFATASIQP